MIIWNWWKSMIKRVASINISINFYLFSNSYLISTSIAAKISIFLFNCCKNKTNAREIWIDHESKGTPERNFGLFEPSFLWLTIYNIHFILLSARLTAISKLYIFFLKLLFKCSDLSLNTCQQAYVTQEISSSDPRLTIHRLCPKFWNTQVIYLSKDQSIR